ncbi:TraB/GumN family protein [Shewanella waksmanii]|uniref:TraB/GumN family protein n=1 Tax=Shewanella waksmanii TaxID=213783 RepID=UPI003734CAFA
MATSHGFRLLQTLGVSALVGMLSSTAMAADTPPFYQVNYQGKTAYLLGSIHVGQPSFYPMAEIIEEKFAKASGLVVEVDTDNIDVMPMIQQYGLDPSGITPHVQKVKNSYCQTQAVVCQGIASFSPWLQSVQVGMVRFGQLGYSAEFGVDGRFVKQNGQRPLYELESSEFQFKLLSGFSKTQQWDMVAEAIETSDKQMLALVEAWRGGDEQALAELMTEQMVDDDDTEMIDKILWQRNVNMAVGIRQLMQDPKVAEPLFIVVGAGHVVGKQSIVDEMRSHGAKVRNCWQQKCQ